MPKQILIMDAFTGVLCKEMLIAIAYMLTLHTVHLLVHFFRDMKEWAPWLEFKFWGVDMQ